MLITRYWTKLYTILYKFESWRIKN